MIDDDDCDVSEPTPVDENQIQSGKITRAEGGDTVANALIPVIPVVRIAAQLKKTLKSKTIAAATLMTYDEHFKTIMATFPEPFTMTSQAYLDPRLLMAACTLQTVRFLLYRHNLSPICRSADRSDALERCVSVAADTARYIERSMQPGGASPSSNYYSTSHMASWAARLRTMAPAFFCTHLWRCALVSCLRLEFAQALTIVQASASIGDLRKNNIGCGRHLAFFLDKLMSRLRSGANRQTLQSDEEMLAYASGDLQAAAEESWVWVGSETGANLNKTQSNGFAIDRAEPQTPNPLTERERHEWGGWDHVQRILNMLLQEQQGHYQQHSGSMQTQLQTQVYQQQQQASHGPGTYPPPPSTPSQHLAPLQTPSQQPSVSPAPSSVSGNNGGSNRISIKDII